ncbi:hypothetical protein H632_c3844p0, partial [Helicosporidium sp. ATCC 50920]
MLMFVCLYVCRMGRRGRPARRPREEDDDVDFAVALAPKTRDERRFSRGRGGRRGGAQHAAPGRGRGKQSEYFSEPGESSSSSCSGLEGGFEALGSDEELISRFLRTSLASPLQPGGSEEEASVSGSEEAGSSGSEEDDSGSDGSGTRGSGSWSSDGSLSEWEAEALICLDEEGVGRRSRRFKSPKRAEDADEEDSDSAPGPPTLASQFPIYSRPPAPPGSKKNKASGKKAGRDKESAGRKKESRRAGIEARRAARALRK